MRVIELLLEFCASLASFAVAITQLATAREQRRATQQREKTRRNGRASTHKRRSR